MALLIEKTQYTLFNMSNTYCLKHVVKFAYKDKMGKRRGYHSVISYASDQYIQGGISEVANINVYFKSYLNIECIDKSIPWENRQFISITEYGIHRLRSGLKKVKKWFKKKEYDDLYFIEDNQLKLNKEMVNEKGLVHHIYFENDRSLTITPAVINDRTQSYEGVVMFINNRNSAVELSIGELKTLYNIVKEMNLYLAGLAMLNYLGKPDIIPEIHRVNELVEQKIYKKNNTFNRDEYIQANNSLNNKTMGYFNN